MRHFPVMEKGQGARPWRLPQRRETRARHITQIYLHLPGEYWDRCKTLPSAPAHAGTIKPWLMIPDRLPLPPRLVGRFVASQALRWLLAAPLLGAVVARLAVWVQNFRSPLLLFPLLVGCGLGLLLLGLMRLGQVGHRATLWRGASGRGGGGGRSALFQFPRFQSGLTAQRRPPAGPSALQSSRPREMMPDVSTDFVDSCSVRRPWGGRDRGLCAARRGRLGELGLRRAACAPATSAIIFLACRTPYCSVCRSWYRTTRAGPLAADKARRVPPQRGCPARNRSAQDSIGFPTASAVADHAGWNWRARPIDVDGCRSMAPGHPARASGGGLDRMN